MMTKMAAVGAIRRVFGPEVLVVCCNGMIGRELFTAEMAKWTDRAANPDHPQAKSWLLYGDGQGNFRKEVFTTGFGFHEARLFDADADGDVDVVSKPYNWDTPRLDVWLNPGPRR